MPVYNETDKNKWTKDKRHWYFRCSYDGLDGNRKRYKSKMYATQDEAKNAESEFMILIKNYDNIAKKVPFKNIFDEWLFYKKRKIKTSTYYDQKTIATKYILKKFEKRDIFSIKESDINLWLEDINKLNFSIKYKNKIIRFFKEILMQGCNNYHMNKKNVNLLHSIKDETPVEKEELDNFWTYQEWLKFIEAVDDETDYLLFNFLYFTGCRIGEVLALNYNDIDFKNKTVFINKTLNSKTGNGKVKITSPKTNNSVRKIDLTDNLFNLIEKHYNKEKKIIGFKKSWFIFGNMKHLSETTVRRKYNHYIRRITAKDKNFKVITIHGFRHSHVSLLVYLGCDFRDIAERLGDTITMVQNTYYHMYPETKSKTIDLLNKLK